MVFLQSWPFFQAVIFANIRQENVFCGVLERKNTFEGYKKKESKNWKREVFSKVVIPWFAQTIGLSFMLLH